jgi:hypothetical protein
MLAEKLSRLSESRWQSGFLQYAVTAAPFPVKKLKNLLKS